MRLRNNQSGFSVVEVAILAVVIVGVGFVAYTVYNRKNATTANSNTPTKTSNQLATEVSDVASAPYVKSATDLDKASDTLDKTDPDKSNNADTSQLDQDLATF